MNIIAKTRVLFCAFIVFASALAVEASQVEAEVHKLEGWAEYALPGETEFRPLRPTTRLPHGSRVRTSDDSTVLIRVTPGSAIRISPNSEITIDGMEFEVENNVVKKRKARISLSAGTISALLDHRNPEATDFRIETPQGSAAARGTFYAVSYVEGETFVTVENGKVGFIKPKEETAEESESSDAQPAKTE